MLTPDSFDRGLDTAKRSLGRIVRLRLAGLSAEARAVAESIALLESDVNLPVLARVARIDPTSALGAVDELDRADLISATTLVFTHPLLRDAVGGLLNPHQRSTAHRRCAAILHQAGAPLERVCGHLLQVAPGADHELSDLLLRGAARAMANAAPGSAIGYLSRALEESADNGVRRRALFELAAGMRGRRSAG